MSPALEAETRSRVDHTVLAVALSEAQICYAILRYLFGGELKTWQRVFATKEIGSRSLQSTPPMTPPLCIEQI